MFDLYLTGQYSLAEICKIADKDWGFRTIKSKRMGGVPLCVASLYKILISPFYYGKV